ncbi:BolA family transcriptional regulator [Limnohabitans sp. T6-5]|uniref:BolA family protein n=1 Tax=Limnohabitans sp. T6-5 TaxID=1100724 RepID=UPI000D3AE78D|nr:BolA family protein [Limnohabitans sp. T6-5]PUE08752.1 BolA family transcriptional regulator [Limnohabitans sp. T6-5]
MSGQTQASVSQRIQDRLTERLQPTALKVIDESAAHAGHAGASASGEGSHIRVCIASPLFTTLSRVQRHRLVYDALQDFIDQGLHALAIELI